MAAIRPAWRRMNCSFSRPHRENRGDVHNLRALQRENAKDACQPKEKADLKSSRKTAGRPDLTPDITAYKAGIRNLSR